MLAQKPSPRSRYGRYLAALPIVLLFCGVFMYKDSVAQLDRVAVRDVLPAVFHATPINLEAALNQYIDTNARPDPLDEAAAVRWAHGIHQLYLDAVAQSPNRQNELTTVFELVLERNQLQVERHMNNEGDAYPSAIWGFPAHIDLLAAPNSGQLTNERMYFAVDRPATLSSCVNSGRPSACQARYLRQLVLDHPSGKNLHGQVRVGFLVTSKGAVSHIKTATDTDPALAAAAYAVIQALPAFAPATRDGKLVQSGLSLLLRFGDAARIAVPQPNDAVMQAFNRKMNQLLAEGGNYRSSEWKNTSRQWSSDLWDWNVQYPEYSSLGFVALQRFLAEHRIPCEAAISSDGVMIRPLSIDKAGTSSNSSMHHETGSDETIRSERLGESPNTRVRNDLARIDRQYLPSSALKPLLLKYLDTHPLPATNQPRFDWYAGFWQVARDFRGYTSPLPLHTQDQTIADELLQQVLPRLAEHETVQHQLFDWYGAGEPTAAEREATVNISAFEQAVDDLVRQYAQADAALEKALNRQLIILISRAKRVLNLDYRDVLSTVQGSMRTHGVSKIITHSNGAFSIGKYPTKDNLQEARFPRCENETSDNRSACVREQMALFKIKHLQYPDQAIARATEGSAVVQFTVAADGALSNFRLFKDPGDGLGKEALRLARLMPDWVPATRNGKAVESSKRILIAFELPQVIADTQVDTIPTQNTDPTTEFPTTQDKYNDPLLVVDGTIVPFAFEDIDPDNIESIAVIKGKKAVAEYGAQGSAGVIEVTTKDREENNSVVIGDYPILVAVNGKAIGTVNGTDPAAFARKISPLYIDRIELYGGKRAVRRYGPDAAIGVLEITTQERPRLLPVESIDISATGGFDRRGADEACGAEGQYPKIILLNDYGQGDQELGHGFSVQFLARTSGQCIPIDVYIKGDPKVTGDRLSSEQYLRRDDWEKLGDTAFARWAAAAMQNERISTRIYLDGEFLTSRQAMDLPYFLRELNNDEVVAVRSSYGEAARKRMGRDYDGSGIFELITNEFLPVDKPQELNPDKQLKLSPNPATDQLQISFPLSLGVATISLLDTEGRVLWTEQVRKLPGENYEAVKSVAALSPGTYYIRAESTDLLRVGAFSKQ